MSPLKRPVAVVTDSASDITPEQARQHDVRVVPLCVTFPDRSYLDGVELRAEEFYEKLVETGEIPITSQPSPSAFTDAFREKLDAGYDVVCLTISSRLSGTYQSACLARDLLEPEEQEHIRVFDTLNLCIGELLLVRMAVRMRNDGLAADTIVATLEHLRGRVRLVALFDTLKYLQKGGRIPAGVAFAGKMLSIKPVIGCEKGKIAILGKARGSKHGQNMIVKMIDKYGGVSYDRPIHFCYTGMSDGLLRKYLRDNEDLYGTFSDDLPINCAGATIGTHAGPGAIAFAFFSRE